MMVVPVVVGYNFSMIYVDSGPLSQILAPFLEPFGINPRIRWLSQPRAAQVAIIRVSAPMAMATTSELPSCCQKWIRK